jgi:FMN phosphatase YigB (HAD superfamily)
VDLLVDDHPAHVAAAQQMGIRAVLWPQPWNTARATVAQALAVVTAAAQWGAGDEIV